MEARRSGIIRAQSNPIWVHFDVCLEAAAAVEEKFTERACGHVKHRTVEVVNGRFV